MSATYFFLILAVCAGAVLPLQAAANNRMATTLSDPVLAALVSFLVGTVGLLGYIFATGVPVRDLGVIRNASAVSWIGGLFGAFFVASTAILVPRIGVAMTFSLVVAGQMLVTLIVDHYGVLGAPVSQISLGRVAGILLIIGGVILIRRF